MDLEQGHLSHGEKLRPQAENKLVAERRAGCFVLDGVLGTLGERNHPMTITEMLHEEEETAQQRDPVEILQDAQHAEDRRQHKAEAKLQHMQDEGEFIRLSRRHAHLARSFTAENQRERASLQVPLMKLYATLHPKSIYKWDDDFDVVMRAERRP